MEELIQRLRSSEDDVFEEELLLKIRKYKGVINDELLKIVKEEVDRKKESYCPIAVCYAISMLGEFEDKRLYPFLLSLITDKSIDMQEYFEDTILDYISCIMYRIYEDANGYINLIKNEYVHVYIKSELLNGYAMLYLKGKVNKKDFIFNIKDVANYFKYDNDFEYFYSDIFDIINYFKFKEFNSLKEKLSNKFYFEEMDINFNLDFDAVERLKNSFHFRCFDKLRDSKINLAETKKIKFKMEDAYPFYDSESNGTKYTEKIGRNELCPCGSGKKYKKCCGK